MKVLSVVGARPQFVKLAPIAQAASDRDVEHIVVHTGQHYDENMSQSFFDELGIPEPDENLHVGSSSHADQTGRMLMALEPLMVQHQPDWVLVYGDTNSTLAAAVCATKLHLPLAHLEAGLRSFNRRMPEEHNRVLTDHSADLCLAPTQVAMDHLEREGLAARSVLVGDVMTDVLRATEAQVTTSQRRSLPDDDYFLATLHRPDNTDDARRLSDIVAALAALPHTVLVAAHPRLMSKVTEHHITLEQGAIRVVPPLAYPDLVATAANARGVITDSGGLQKEAFLLGIPTTTVRSETEWVETLAGGWNELVDDPRAIVTSALRTLPTADRGEPYGDGRAALRVIDTLCQFDSGNRSS